MANVEVRGEMAGDLMAYLPVQQLLDSGHSAKDIDALRSELARANREYVEAQAAREGHESLQWFHEHGQQTY